MLKWAISFLLLTACGESPSSLPIRHMPPIVMDMSIPTTDTPTYLAVDEGQWLHVSSAGLTIVSHVVLSAKTNNEVIAAKDNDATKEGSEYWLGYEKSSDRFNFQIEDQDGTTYFVKANSLGSPQINVPYTIIGWGDSTSVYIQVNDYAVDSVKRGTSPRVTATPFSIGSDAGQGSFMHGQITNVGLWRRPLNFEERQSAKRAISYEALDPIFKQEGIYGFPSWWDLSNKGIDSRGNSPLYALPQ